MIAWGAWVYAKIFNSAFERTVKGLATSVKGVRASDATLASAFVDQAVVAQSSGGRHPPFNGDPRLSRQVTLPLEAGTRVIISRYLNPASMLVALHQDDPGVVRWLGRRFVPQYLSV